MKEDAAELTAYLTGRMLMTMAGEFMRLFPAILFSPLLFSLYLPISFRPLRDNPGRSGSYAVRLYLERAALSIFLLYSSI